VTPPSNEPVDARGDRLVQGIVGVLLLAAFVFGLVWLVPAIGVLLGIGAALGPARNPFHLAYARFLAPRIQAVEGTVPGDTVRAQDALVAAVCGLASLSFLAGIRPIGWFLVVAAALAAIFAATTRMHLGDLLLQIGRGRHEG
jgi:hypothetical protein